MKLVEAKKKFKYGKTYELVETGQLCKIVGFNGTSKNDIQSCTVRIIDGYNVGFEVFGIKFKEIREWNGVSTPRPQKTEKEIARDFRRFMTWLGTKRPDGLMIGEFLLTEEGKSGVRSEAQREAIRKAVEILKMMGS